MSQGEAQLAMSDNYTFRGILGLTKVLKLLLGLDALMALMAILSSVMQAQLLVRGTVSSAEWQANDSRAQIVDLSDSLLGLCTIIIFGLWIFRANRNVRALGASGLSITPGWAVGYFFVPFLHLWMPYRAMRDLWRASRDPYVWETVVVSPVLPRWWTLWIISGFVGIGAHQARMAVDGVRGLDASTFFDIVNAVVEVPLCLVAMTLVTQIANAQESQNPSRT